MKKYSFGFLVLSLLSLNISLLQCDPTMENAPPPTPFGYSPHQSDSQDYENLPEDSPYKSFEELPPEN